MEMFQEDKNNQLCPMKLPNQVRGGLGINTGLGQVQVCVVMKRSFEGTSLSGVMETSLIVCFLGRMENEEVATVK